MKRKKKIILITFTALIIQLFLIAFILLPYFVMGQILDTKVRFSRVFTPEEFGITATPLSVQTVDGLKISAFEVKSEQPTKAVILCLSGIHNPSVTAFYGHAKMFKEHGYSSILIDMRAHGESEGEQICAGYKEYLDVDAVVDYVKEQPSYHNVPIIVMGLSLGGATAINAIANNEHIDALISLSAFSSWEEAFRDNMAMSLPHWLANLLSPFVDVATELKYGDASSVKPIYSISQLGQRPALLIHSREDSQVPYTHFKRLLQNAPKGTDTLTVEGDNHLITGHFTIPENDSIYSNTLLKFINSAINR